MPFRVVTLKLELDHKRWAARRALIIDELARLAPDLTAFNEVCVPLQSARDLRAAAAERTGHDYTMIQQTKVNSLSKIEEEALLTRFPLIETGNLDYQTRDMVTLVTRMQDVPVDVYVTHLFMSRRRRLVAAVSGAAAWPGSTAAAMGAGTIVCGDLHDSLDAPSTALMATRFRPTQLAPTAFTPLAGRDGEVSHPYWPRTAAASTTSGSRAASRSSQARSGSTGREDSSLWPSDHAGV